MYARLHDPAMVAEVLDRVCAAAPDLHGAVVASRDGLVVAARIAPDLSSDSLDAGRAATKAGFSFPDTAAKTAAMAAVAAGLGAQFVAAAANGEFQAVTFEGARGCCGVFPLTTAMLLVLLGRPQVTMGRFLVAAKGSLAILLGPNP